MRLEFTSLNGQTHLIRRKFRWPFFVGRQLRSPEAPAASITTVQSASSTLNAGDSTQAAFVVGDDAHAILRTQGAPSVHRSRDGTKIVESTEIIVGARGVAEVVAEPRVLFPGSRYEQKTSIQVQAGAHVLFAEGVVALRGESGETFTEYASETRVSRDGTLLMRDATATGPWDAMPSRVSTLSAVGQIVVITEDSHVLPAIGRDRSDENRYIASSLLPNNAGVMVRVAATNGLHLRQSLGELAAVMRAALIGR
ncbi:urease accessory protein UreD [Microbacterium sp.]|uniref:urease accessory protein UreD n=1 Tax=Microbacterium sp. TaxID=51671 RepID=UPI003A9232FC